MKWDDAGFISLHGRPRRGFLTRLKRQAKVALFTDDDNSPPRLAAHMYMNVTTLRTQAQSKADRHRPEPPLAPDVAAISVFPG